MKRLTSKSLHLCEGNAHESSHTSDAPAVRKGELLFTDAPPETSQSRCGSSRTARGARCCAVSTSRRNAWRASVCGSVFRLVLRCTISGSVAKLLFLTHLVQCASSLGGIGRPPSMTTMGRNMMPILRSDPEYACVYEDSKVDLQNRIGAASTYRMHLAAQNSRLRSNVIEHRSGAEATAGDRLGIRAGISEETASSENPSQSVSVGPYNHDAGVVRNEARVEAPGRAAEGNSRESQWRNDVGQRYKELIPPKHPQPGKQNGGARPKVKSRILSAEDFRKAAEAALSNSISLSWSPPGEPEAGSRQRVEEAVLVLDLDKCSFWGSDGNDLGIALQWMERSTGLVHELYRLLLNPQVKATYTRLKDRAKTVRVVIYTMRATFLVYHSCFRDQIVPLRWHHDWHHGAQIFIPPSVPDAETVMRTYSMAEPLLEEEFRDLKKSFERLLATRAVLAEELSLERLPDLVVTASPKDVEGTMRQLGIPVENAYLWDDNVKLKDNPRVVHVPHFDALPLRQHAALMTFLNTHCPAHMLEDDLVDFMMGADPADIAIARDETSGRLFYRIPVAEAQAEWTLPCLVQTRIFEDRDVKSPKEAGRQKLLKDYHPNHIDHDLVDDAQPRAPASSGHLSPVTPEHELDVAY